ncbi:CHASE2 domain-containing protein [Marinicaulis aureus]|uniref:CHASE2 domain-containing protein n=1 Tax=Hyphococcus aureus TaxID=2666033 RepID=A0ABW1L2P6_9PROT
MKRRIFGPRLAGVIGAALALAMVFYEPALINSARDRLFDQYQRLSPRTYDSAPVRVVEIDDAALEKYGQWPWPRHRLATIVDRLSDAGAAVIVLDIILAEPDRTSPVNVTANWLEAPQLAPVAAELSMIDLSAVDHDARLAASLASAPTVLHLTARAGATGGACPAPLDGAKIGGMTADELTRIAPSFRSVVPSLPQFRAAASGEGFARTGLSNDAVVRGAPMVALACEGKEIYPGLAIEALRVAAPRLDPQLAPRGFKVAADRPCRAHVKGIAGQSISEVSLCGLHIPTTEDGELWVHYASPEAMAVRWISVVDILEGDAKDIEAAVKGRIVMIGASAEGLRDVMVTPLGDERPGVHIHAEIIEQVLSGKTLFRAWDVMRPIEIAVAGFVVLLLLLFLPRMTAAAGFAVWLALAAALFGGAFTAFTTSRLLIDPVAPGLVLTLSFLGAFVVLFQQEQIARRFIRGAFGKFLSPLILERLERDPGLLKLEGETREITAFFSDIRGFTTISHSLSAVQVTSLLNQYFTEMTKIVTDHNGLVDKYMGDGMAAMWNAPIDVANHPAQAARASLAMLTAVDKLNAEWRGNSKHGLPEIRIGIGLHTDEAQVGNFGSEDHLEYSMLGDMVNLTSRLEALNKVYAAPIIISASTQARIPDFAAVPLGRFTAAGRSEMTEIYALAGDEALARRPAFQTFTETFAAGLAALEAGDGAAARRYFGALKQGEAFGLSGAIDVFLARADQINS